MVSTDGKHQERGTWGSSSASIDVEAKKHAKAGEN